MFVQRGKQVEELGKKVDMIPVDIRRGVATAVTRETAAIAEELKAIRERQSEVEKIVARAPPRPETGADVGVAEMQRGKRKEENSDRYWEARKCAKMSPIRGKSQEEMMEGVRDFIFNMLGVGDEDFDIGDVTGVRRIRSPGPGIENECLVIFNSVERRDFVYSHARNLAGQPVVNGKRIYNLRMHVPSHLLECFRTLDQHGHLLKLRYDKLGNKLRRHVNYDDDAESLYLDVKVSKDEPWERVYPEFAREERKRREKKTAMKRRDRLSSIIETSEDDCGESSDETVAGCSGERGRRPRK